MCHLKKENLIFIYLPNIKVSKRNRIDNYTPQFLQEKRK